jgi:DNA-binding LytR/AlgR family response regulator
LNTKLKCLLLDDELPSLTYLKMLCEQIPELEIVRAFNNAVLFLKEVPHLEFDLCILDIEMPDFNGLQIASTLKGKPVIFTTGYSQYAAEAFDLDAIDYVRKPIKPERLQLAVQKAVLRTDKGSAPKNFIQLNTDKGKTLIIPDQIGYISTSETDSRDKVVYMLDYTTIVLKNISFAGLLEILPVRTFSRINKKELIALRSVHSFSHDTITTNIVQPNGKPLVLLLNDTYRKEFIKLVSL